MKFTEAFQALGYDVHAPLQDWSAANERGVCLTLWESGVERVEGIFIYDTRRRGGPIEIWGKKPGNRKRIEHLKNSSEHQNGLVDVIIVKGNGTKVDDADPWLIDKRRARWRIIYFDPLSGHFRAEQEPVAVR